MTYYANSSQRAQLITGLRQLAEFLDSNPDVPTPPDATVFVFPPPEGDDQERRAEIDAIASRLFTQASTTRVGGHYVTSRFFGSVEYRAVAISRENTEEGAGR
jgi:hypothetical protein